MDYSGSRIDHLNLPVSDLARSVAFYSAALAPLGIVTTMAVPAHPASGQKALHAFGWSRKPFFWLVEGGRGGYDADTHLAFTVDDRAGVDAFWEAALAAGAVPRSAPAVHPEYQPHYYGAFVDDPDGINLEAVCQRPVEADPSGPSDPVGVAGHGPEGTRPPEVVLRRLLDAVSRQAWDEAADLYAEDAVVEHPMAAADSPAPRRLLGREAVRAHLRETGERGSGGVARDVRIHATADPELVVVEVEHQGVAEDQPFIRSDVLVTRVREGLVVESRDHRGPIVHG